MSSTRRRFNPRERQAIIEALVKRDGTRCANVDCRRPLFDGKTIPDIAHVNNNPESKDVRELCLTCRRCNRSRAKLTLIVGSAIVVQRDAADNGAENGLTVRYPIYKPNQTGKEPGNNTPWETAFRAWAERGSGLLPHALESVTAPMLRALEARRLVYRLCFEACELGESLTRDRLLGRAAEVPMAPDVQAIEKAVKNVVNSSASASFHWELVAPDSEWSLPKEVVRRTAAVLPAPAPLPSEAADKLPVGVVRQAEAIVTSSAKRRRRRAVRRGGDAWPYKD